MNNASESDMEETLPAERPPGPDGVPLLGNTVDLYRDVWGFYDDMAAYGDVVSYSAGTIDFTVLLHPKHIQRVLVTEPEQFGKWGLEELGGEMATEGLVLTEGEQWRRQRDLIQDAFTIDRIQGYGDAIGRLATETVQSWDDGTELRLNEAFSQLTLRILAQSLFDLDIEDGSGQITAFARAINDRSAVDSISAFIPLWVPTPANRRFKRKTAAFQSFLEDLIERRRNDPESHDDLLSVLLRAGDDESGLSDSEIRDQLMTFLLAGHETTSLALTYACMALASHPGARDRLDAEYESVLGGTVPSFEQTTQLPATERAINETLRLYPPAYITFREARRDLAFDGYLIPEGTKLTLPQFYIHRDGRWWDDPEQFRPERWLDGGDDRPEYAYFPFGGGPRHCIGMRFAMLELKTILPTVLQSVEFELLSDPTPEFQMGATLRPADPVRVRVHKHA